MIKKVLIAAFFESAFTLNAECEETDHSMCESSECCGVLEEEGFDFFEVVEEFWGAHHEHIHHCHDETATTYEDEEG